MAMRPPSDRSPSALGVAWALAVAVASLGPGAACAHEATFGLAGKKLLLQTRKGKPQFRYLALGPGLPSVGHDPSTVETWLLVHGAGAATGLTGKITLDPSKWRRIGKGPTPKGYRYLDKSRARGGVKKVIMKKGKLLVVAGGPGWPWMPAGPQDEVWVDFGIDDETYCARFDGGAAKRNQGGRFMARDAPAPNACPASICGNGRLELGETCDDGNLVEDDGCTSSCAAGECKGASYPSTFAAIQDLVFDRYGCTSAVCHGKVDGEGGLSLLPDVAYQNLVGVPSQGSSYNRVEPGSPRTSALYLKLLKATEPDTDIPGASMPSGLAPIPAQLLEAIREWIVRAAPEASTVDGTQALLGACFPDPVPISIQPLPDPDPSEGMQIEMPPVHIDPQSEFEICFATYYDVSAVVPEQYKDPTGQFFYTRLDANRIDPNSHHLVIINSGLGEADVADPSFGTWRCAGGPSDGAVCDPLVADGCGADGFCRSEIRPNVGCIGYGPPGGGNAAGAADSLGGAGNGQVAVELEPGQYRKVPLKAIVYWNLHAFNLTDLPHDLKAYLNLYFTDDLQTEVGPFLDFSNIYVAAGQPPYTRQTYCRPHTFPQGTHVIFMSSHTHGRGEAFWVNDPDGNRIYESFTYEDPVVVAFDPPLDFTDPDPATRTVEYCATYDNGLNADDTPNPVTVRRRSNTPPNASLCTPTACTAGKIGAPCDGVADDATCDSAPGAGDGLCDACPITAGVSTQDEMFVLSGWSYQD
jgi:cysteine-rich repeat protein